MLIHEKKIVQIHDLAGTFAGLMDLYERNYIGLRRLAPALPPIGESLVSEVSCGLDLHLRTLQRFRYTTELSLTYFFTAGKDMRAEPDLCLRIYHDARQAEVVSAQLRHWPLFCAEDCTELRARWRVNRFLFKWLNYCLHQGHSFAPREAAKPVL